MLGGCMTSEQPISISISRFMDMMLSEREITWFLPFPDTGEGIPELDLNRIFEPFYTKKIMGRSGTGLGLAVVWGTVKDHQGYINVESEAGKGAILHPLFSSGKRKHFGRISSRVH